MPRLKSTFINISGLLIISFFSVFSFPSCTKFDGKTVEAIIPPVEKTAEPTKPTAPVLDSAAYQTRFKALNSADSTGKWGQLESVYPKVGAILPFKRVIAYYGNFYSKRMGILGELPEDEMLDSLQSESKKWEAADPETPVMPAIHYICVTAQKSPGKGGKYRLRMPFSQIEKALAIANKINGILILDIQIGHSSLQEELPQLDTFLLMPNVHLGIDPEFSMQEGARPGGRIGSFDAEDINFAAKYLAGLVKLKDLPPKMLIVHRFTKPMITNYKNIEPLPEVQIVMQMDGWGGKAKKRGTYKQVIYPEPVQFTGFKVFYKNDLKKTKSDNVMQPNEILELKPKPIYIQYQ